MNEHLWLITVLLLTAYIINGTETFVLNSKILQVPLLIYAKRYKQVLRLVHKTVNSPTRL